MKRILILSLLSLAVCGVTAQYPARQTLVLDDGSRITGTIISDSSGLLYIKVRKAAVISLNRYRIVSAGKPEKFNLFPQDQHGYNIKLSGCILAGNSSEGRVHSFSFHFSNSYLFRNGIEAGAGAGIENIGVLLVPVYADIRYQPFRSKVSPFLWVKTGYAFPVSEYEGNIGYYWYNSGKTKGGFMFNPGIGIALYSWKGNAITLGTGYRIQRISYKQDETYRPEYPTYRELLLDFSRFELQLGFIFR